MPLHRQHAQKYLQKFDFESLVKLDRQLTDYKSHLLVFGDEAKTQQEWLWLKLELGKSAKVRSHSYKVSQNPIVPDPTKQAALNAYRDVERGLIK